MYAIPIVGAHRRGTTGIDQLVTFSDTVIDVPDYLIQFFDVNIDGEVDNRSTSAIQVRQAQLGSEAELPWDLDLRALGFWRSAPGHTFDFTYDDDEEGYLPPQPAEHHGRKRAMGLELLLRRTLAPGVVDGWIGYTVVGASRGAPGSVAAARRVAAGRVRSGIRQSNRAGDGARRGDHERRAAALRADPS